jgi:hypothetical protein
MCNDDGVNDFIMTPCGCVTIIIDHILPLLFDSLEPTLVK